MKRILNYLAAAVTVLLVVIGLILTYLIIADLQYNEEDEDFNENGHETSQLVIKVKI
ncbi:hypothetical protein SAMN05421743_1033 [Thalassobacillus cyri]|uniref:Uncharacterized protein n=1 Tax=Thalassobacillus cyri TaxID=571932 RepID=A0A1H3YSV8_9BACI|nr:hypothetical protein [Thalassobacillus cyri]SEA14114.1 hypothetical protein SAMN05421743_1033 [Thalassobacillus cyri]